MLQPSPCAPPFFTLHLGAFQASRVPEDVVEALIRERGVESFSLTETKGWFKGVADPGWAIKIATDDTALIADLAEALRVSFGQEGVGVEAFGRYLRCRADHGPTLLSAELWGLKEGFHPAYYRTVFSADETDSWPARFAIVTAYATTGETWSAERNQQGDRDLLARIEERGYWHKRVTGASPDGLHAEPGWAIEVSIEEAQKLGCDFRQDAIYFVEAALLHVASCFETRIATVGSFRPRLNTQKGATIS